MLYLITPLFPPNFPNTLVCDCKTNAAIPQLLAHLHAKIGERGKHYTC